MFTVDAESEIASIYQCKAVINVFNRKTVAFIWFFDPVPPVAGITLIGQIPGEFPEEFHIHYPELQSVTNFPSSDRATDREMTRLREESFAMP